jgi:1,4-dihydroxy-2-naphthoate octaprenyltransferase
MDDQMTPTEPSSAGSLKTWFLELRPQFLLLSVLLVPIGTAVAWHQGSFNLVYFLLAWAGTVLAHISVNVLNDYFDHQSRLDFHTQQTPFSGGSGILTAGLLEPTRVYILGVASLLIAAVIGVYFIAVRGWGLLPILLIGGLAAYFYTPLFSRWQIGELLAGLGLGTLVVLGAYFVQMGEYSWEAFAVALPPGFLTANLLLLNEFPDLEADREVGRRNLVMALGTKKASWLYTALVAATYLCIILGVALRLMPLPALVGLLTLPVAFKAVQGALQHHDDIPKLIPSLGANVMTILGTNLLLTVGYVLATLFGL